MRKLNAKIERESGVYSGDRMVLVTPRFRRILHAGTGDNIAFRNIDGYVVVLSTRPELDYAGIEIFDSAGDRITDAFWQGETANAVLGLDWDNKTESHLLRVAYHAIIETIE